MLAQVGGVGAVSHDREVALAGGGHEFPPELALAEVATARCVGHIVGVAELVGGNLQQMEIEPTRDRQRLLVLGFRIGRRNPQGGDGPVEPQHPARNHGEQCGVHAAGVTHQDGRIGGDDRLEPRAGLHADTIMEGR